MNESNIKKGGISVETDHIFPIIKKWLYSDKEIFLRELVSNACDAVTKLKRLSALGHYEEPDGTVYRIDVRLDEEAGTLTVSDNGIGMTADEVERYICQMALSGALDFIEKYEGENAAEDGIIGHFGLGFYSAFMVSDTVELSTRSYTGAPAVHWSCTADGEYEIADGDRETMGTDVILHVSDSEKEFLTAARVKEVLEKYCSFMPVEIWFTSAEEEQKKAEEAAKKATEKADDGKEEEAPAAPAPINDVHPLWQKNASDCTDEEYTAFYRRVFNDYREPLFHIHISADYPLNFKGILFFPRLNQQLDSLEGQIKLYYNQVFVADNIKEVIPEYLLMLKGVLDCPELPLNVSRSYLQDSGYVTKIAAHITKKVADKLNGLFNTDRPKFEAMWNDIKVFVEYGCMRDAKFYERVRDSLLLSLTDGRFVTVKEYLEKAKETNENTVYYVSDQSTHARYLSLFAEQGIEVVTLDRMLDMQFVHVIEQDKNVRFVRVDADVASALRGEGEAAENEALTALFRRVSGNEKLKVTYERLKDTRLPALVNIAEDARRMEDMMKVYRLSEESMNLYAPEVTLVVNAACPLIEKLGGMTEEAAAEPVARQIWTLALLSQRQLTADEFRSFLSDSFDLLERSL